MKANNIVLWFSIIVSICVTIWAIFMIRAYNKNQNDN